MTCTCTCTCTHVHMHMRVRSHKRAISIGRVHWPAFYMPRTNLREQGGLTEGWGGCCTCTALAPSAYTYQPSGVPLVPYRTCDMVYSRGLVCIREDWYTRGLVHLPRAAYLPLAPPAHHRQRLEVQLESVTPTTFFVADGVAADHPFSARIEAARKLIGNHEKVQVCGFQ